MADLDPPLPARILIVGANYWPEESGSAPYTSGFAEDLAARGVSVTALVGMPHYPQWRVRDGYAKRLRVRERHNGVEVVHSWLWVPGHQSALQRALWEVSFLATAVTAGGIERPDVVIASTPSLSGAVVARLLARRWRVPYGLVVQDLVGPGAAQSGVPGGVAVSSLARTAEGWVMRGARAIVIVSEAFRPYLAELGVPAGKMEVIPNWVQVPVSTSDRDGTRRSHGWGADVIVLHAGAMGPKQGLSQVVEAARVAIESAPHLRFVLAGDGSARAGLEALASGLTNIEFLPPQEPDAYADLLAAADILLLSQRRGVKDMSLPSKLTSYLAAGRPIVAAVPVGGAASAEVERSGAGIVRPAGDAPALVAEIVGLAGDSGLSSELARAGLVYARSTLGKEEALAGLRNVASALSDGAGLP